MTSSVRFASQVATASLQRAVVVVDQALRLQDLAVRNAANAVAADRVAALLRADAAAFVPAQPAAATRGLSVVGA